MPVQTARIVTPARPMQFHPCESGENTGLFVAYVRYEPRSGWVIGFTLFVVCLLGEQHRRCSRQSDKQHEQREKIWERDAAIPRKRDGPLLPLAARSTVHWMPLLRRS